MCLVFLSMFGVPGCEVVTVPLSRSVPPQVVWFIRSIPVVILDAFFLLLWLVYAAPRHGGAPLSL